VRSSYLAETLHDESCGAVDGDLLLYRWRAAQRSIPRHFAYWLSLRIADVYYFFDRVDGPRY